jgi:hypothetical protein
MRNNGERMTPQELRDYLEDVSGKQLVEVIIDFYCALHEIKVKVDLIRDPSYDYQETCKGLQAIYGIAHKETDRFDFHY